MESHTRIIGPFAHRHGSAVVRNEPIVAAMLILLFAQYPSAVARLVSAVIVSAVNRVLARWASTHVRQECLERTEPLVANLDPTSAVVGIRTMLGVRASRFHPGPDDVLGSFGLSVLEVATSHGVSLKASAASRVSASQKKSRDDHFCSASTPATPHRFGARGRPGERHDRESVKRLPLDINESRIGRFHIETYPIRCIASVANCRQM